MGPPPQRYAPKDVPFSGLCQLLDVVKDAQKSKKTKHLMHFHDSYLEENSEDYFTVYRTLLPHMDRERGYYAIKEQRLAKVLIEACGLSNSDAQTDAKKLLNWRSGATSKWAGDLVETAYECLLVKHCGKPRGTSRMTLGEFHGLLDKLSEGQDLKRQSAVMSKLILSLSPEEMKWALRVILKTKMHLGAGEKGILSCIHPMAQELYNMTMNLKKVCRLLNNKAAVLESQKVKLGSVMRPQLAERINTVESAYSKVKDKEFVVETKFDGERIQLHRQGDDVKYYSRNGLDHGSTSGYSALSDVFRKQINLQDCVLDGEIVVWNKKSQKFLPFGSIKHVVTLIRSEDATGTTAVQLSNDGATDKGSESQVKLKDLEVTYVAFDVLYTRYEGSMQSVIHLPLKERHRLLAQTVTPAETDTNEIKANGVTGRVICILPGESEYSRLGTDEASLQKQFDESIEKMEEGIVIKLLCSQWIAASRSSDWLKIKPDYVTEVEVDGVVIGGYYGTGKRGGVLAQYLIGIPKAKGDEFLLSFCKIGTGLTDGEMQAIHRKLQDNLVDTPPPMYRITGSASEKPHAWVRDPDKSVVLEVIGDVRTIPSGSFATETSLRFPRAKRIRHDKGLRDLTTLEELKEVKPKDLVEGQRTKKNAQSPKKASGRALSVPEEYLSVTVKPSEKKSDFLTGFLFFFLNFGSGEHEKGRVEKSVLENGGEITKNFLKGYDGPKTLCCLADHMDWKAEALKSQDVDILSMEWYSRCVEAQEVLEEYVPKYWLHLGAASRRRLGKLVDKYGDLYDKDLDTEDLEAILKRAGDCDGDDIDEEFFPILEDVIVIGESPGCDFSFSQRDWILEQSLEREELNRKLELEQAARAEQLKRKREEEEALARERERRREREREREEMRAEEAKIDEEVDDLEDFMGSLI